MNFDVFGPFEIPRTANRNIIDSNRLVDTEKRNEQRKTWPSKCSGMLTNCDRRLERDTHRSTVGIHSLPSAHNFKDSIPDFERQQV